MNSKERKMNKCILIKTKDNKRFFTHKNNLETVRKFCEAIEAEIFFATTDVKNILNTKKLTIAMCNADYKSPDEFKILEKIENIKNSKSSISTDIRSYIQESFFNGKMVSLKSIKNEFKDYKLSNPSLCNHISKVRKDLSIKGFVFEKTGTSYKLKNI